MCNEFYNRVLNHELQKINHNQFSSHSTVIGQFFADYDLRGGLR